MTGIKTLGLTALGAAALAGCTQQNFYQYGGPSSPARAAASTPGAALDRSNQALCDVERSRSRADLVKKLSIEKFRQLAAKVSELLTSEDIADLEKLSVAPPSAASGHASAFERRREDVIAEIYEGAIARAGFRSAKVESLDGLDYTIGINTLSFGNDPYVSFVQFKSGKEQEGTITDVLLGARPDQNRYFVGLRRFLRMDVEGDGTQIPVFTTLSLLDAVEEGLPRYCSHIPSALNAEEFNTVGGLEAVQEAAERAAARGARGGATTAPAPAPVPAPVAGTTPGTAPVITPVLVPGGTHSS